MVKGLYAAYTGMINETLSFISIIAAIITNIKSNKKMTVQNNV